MGSSAGAGLERRLLLPQWVYFLGQEDMGIGEKGLLFCDTFYHQGEEVSEKYEGTLNEAHQT